MKARPASPARQTRSRPPGIDPRYPACGLLVDPAAEVDHDETLGDIPIQPVAPWWQHMVPTWSQRYEDCVCHATANAIEGLYRRALGRDAIPEGKQLDPVPMYRKARADHFPSQRWDAGGLFLHHGYLAAVDLGYLPPGSKPGLVSLTLGALCRVLVEQPVLQGTATHGGWARPNPANGQIPIRGYMPNPSAGHATVITAVLKQRNDYYIQFQNSHGARWGYYGYGLYRADQWEQARIGPLCVIVLPDGWERWDGWKKYLIDTPR